MRAVIGRVVPTVRAVVDEIRAENVPFMAGSIAYHAFVSLLPLLFLIVVVGATVGTEDLAFRMVELSERFLPRSGQEVLVEALQGTREDDSGRTGASVIGAVALVWGTLKIFRSLDAAFSDIYGTEPADTVVDRVVDGVVVLFALGAAVTVAAAFGVVFSLVPEGPVDAVLNPLALVAGLAAAFYPMYYVFPDVDVEPTEVLPGVLLAAVGWASLEALFHFYALLSTTSDAYGIAGGVFLLMIWLYIGGFVLLVGAVVNAVLAGRHPDDARLARRIRRRRGGDATTDREAVAAVLSRLAAAFDADGPVTVTVGDERVTLSPPARVHYDVDVLNIGADERGVVVVVTWDDSGDEEPTGPADEAG